MNRHSRVKLLAIGAAASLTGICIAADAQTEQAEAQRAEAQRAEEQARIAFANLGGIRDWRAPDNRTVYVQGRNRQWYRGELFSPCIGLDFANAIGFVVEPSGAFDRFSSIVVDGQQCRLRSLVETEEPPRRGRDRAGEGPQSAESGSAGGDDAAADTAAADSAGTDGQAGQAASEAARIPFAHLGGIRDWRAEDDQTLYIEGRNRQWYRAELFAPCPGLRFQTAVGFVLEPAGQFDRFSAIMVDGRQCRLKSLTEVDEPDARG